MCSKTNSGSSLSGLWPNMIKQSIKQSFAAAWLRFGETHRESPATDRSGLSRTWKEESMQHSLSPPRAHLIHPPYPSCLTQPAVLTSGTNMNWMRQALCRCTSQWVLRRLSDAKRRPLTCTATPRLTPPRAQRASPSL